MRFIYIVLLLLSLPLFAQEWQQQRIDASSNPDEWITKTNQWISQYDEGREFEKLALAYALQSEAYRYSGNETKLIETVKEGLRFAKLADSEVASALLRINQTWYQLQRGQLQQANASVIYAIENAKASGNEDLFIEAEILHAQVMQHAGDIAEALEILEGLNRDAYSAIPKLQVEFHGLIGIIYTDVGAFDIAIEHTLEALEISKEHLGQWDTSVLEYNLARIYHQAGQPNKARQHFETALEISREIEDELGVAYAMFRLGTLELDNENYQAALSNFEQALPQFRSAGAHPMEAETRLSQVEVYLATQQVEVAQQELEAATSLINTLNDDGLKQRLESKWSRYYEKTQQFEKALTHYKSSVEKMKAVQENLQDKQVQEVMVRLEIKEQETTNELLKKENQIQQLALQEQQNSYYLLVLAIITVALLVVIISGFLLQQWRARKNFAELALKDDLTQAPNRRAIVQRCKKELEQAQEQNRSLALAVVDFDYFKSINDEFGHDAGDHVLQRFAKVANESLREQDSYGRLGGEEWLLLFLDASKEDAEQLFKRLQEGLNSQPIEGIPADYQITFSMGFTEALPDDSFDELYKRADDVLYDAKNSGRQRLVIA